jgi:hypothetical protein
MIYPTKAANPALDQSPPVVHGIIKSGFPGISRAVARWSRGPGITLQAHPLLEGYRWR